MSIAAPPKSSSSATHFCYEKGFFYKIRCGVSNSKLVFIQGHPKTVFSENICSERQKLRRIFYSLRKAENFQMTVPFMYNFQSLSDKIPMTPPRRFFGDFIYFFDPVLFFHFCFRGLIRSNRKKYIFVERNNFSLVSTVLFFCDKNLIQFSCDGITAQS